VVVVDGSACTTTMVWRRVVDSEGFIVVVRVVGLARG